MEAQHVEDAHLGHGRSKQFGLLHQARSYQKATIGTTIYGDAPGPGPTGPGQPAGTFTKVVKATLLIGQAPGVVPRAAVLTPAPDAGGG